jgi:hypothetical protein
MTVTVSGKFNVLNINPYVKMSPFVITSSVIMVCEGGT